MPIGFAVGLAARCCQLAARPRTGRAFAVIAILTATAFTLAQRAALAAEPSGKATTARSARDEAIRSIPLDKLSPEAHSKVSAVVNDASLFRRLPLQTVDCEPDLFQFIICNPDVLVNIWQVMGVTNVALERIDANHFRCTDGDGTTARVEVVFRGRETQIIYAEGFYDGPLLPTKVRGQCVAVLKHVSAKESNGRYYETVRLDTFVRVENIGVELVARLFQGLVGRTIDHNFAETVAFLGSVSRTAETNPRGMRRLIAKLEHVTPERREQFVAVADRVSTKLTDVRGTDSDENPALAEVVQSSAQEEATRRRR